MRPLGVSFGYSLTTAACNPPPRPPHPLPPSPPPPEPPAPPPPHPPLPAIPPMPPPLGMWNKVDNGEVVALDLPVSYYATNQATFKLAFVTALASVLNMTADTIYVTNFQQSSAGTTLLYFDTILYGTDYDTVATNAAIHALFNGTAVGSAALPRLVAALVANGLPVAHAYYNDQLTTSTWSQPPGAGALPAEIGTWVEGDTGEVVALSIPYASYATNQQYYKEAFSAAMAQALNVSSNSVWVDGAFCSSRRALHRSPPAASPIAHVPLPHQTFSSLRRARSWSTWTFRCRATRRTPPPPPSASPSPRWSTSSRSATARASPASAVPRALRTGLACPSWSPPSSSSDCPAATPTTTSNLPPATGRCCCGESLDGTHMRAPSFLPRNTAACGWVGK